MSKEASEIGLWIPPSILRKPELTDGEKMLLAAIIPLTFGRSCTAKNEHFSEQLGMKKQTVTNNLSSLHEKGFIRICLWKTGGNKREIYTYIHEGTLYQYVGYPIQKDYIGVYKNFVEVYKVFVEGIEKDYIPYIKSLSTLYKNFVHLYKEESKEEIEVEKEIEIIKGVDSDFSKSDSEEKQQNPPPVPPPPSLEPFDERRLSDEWLNLKNKILESHTCSQVANTNISQYRTGQSVEGVVVEFLKAQFAYDGIKYPYRELRDGLKHFNNWVPVTLPTFSKNGTKNQRSYQGSGLTPTAHPPVQGKRNLDF